VAPAVLARGGGVLYWVEEHGGPPTKELLDADPEAVARLILGRFHTVAPARRRAWSERAGSAGLRADPDLADALAELKLRVEVASREELRRARDAMPERPVEAERRLLLPLARLAVGEALASPDETLVALAREEARLERSLGREQGAVAQWASAPSGPLADHRDSARRFRAAFEQHHAEIEDRIERAAREHVPNLAHLVGPKLAARLVAAAGSRAALARCSGSRIQLLGAKRRPDPERGPRFGVLYRAPGLEELPTDRQGRYARSLAAMAAIAIRADAFTHRDLGDRLVLRRDRRLLELRRAQR
jgi:snoRNA binding domain, fibrillarin